MTKWMVLGGIFLLGCGTQASAPPTQRQITESPVEAEPPTAQPLISPAEPTPPTPLPTLVVTNQVLTKHARSPSEQIVLGKRCTFVDGECDSSTTLLTLDDKPLNYRPPDATLDSPFGDWKEINVFQMKKGELVLTLTRVETIQHIHIKVDSGIVNELAVKQWPRKITKEFKHEIDVNGDGKPESLHSSCDAFALSYEPTECMNFTLWLGSQKLYEDKDSIFGPDVSVELLDASTSPSIRIAAHGNDYSNYTKITILSMKNGAFEQTYQSRLAGVLKWKKDGSWTERATDCEKPARLRYDKSGKTIVLAYGTERYRDVSYQWKDGAVSMRVPKRWKKRKSKCQTEGRCPHVYAGQSDTAIGEILKDQVGTDNWRNESLTIPRALVKDGILSILIAEEKPDEISYIDDMWLVVGNTTIRPQSCVGSVCGLDRRTKSLAPGESIRMTFANLPDEGTIRFFANGYYIYTN